MVSGKKLNEASATTENFNPRMDVIAMMNMTQKSPKRKRMVKDPSRERELKIAYGIKDP
jgi:hypothetical protein